MDERTQRVLEFDKIKKMLLSHHETEMGKELAEVLEPLTDLEEIRQLQRETSEAKEILLREVNLPSLGGMRDVRESLHRASLGSVLEPEDLLDIKQTLSVARQIKSFLLDRKEDYPKLAYLAGKIFALRELEEIIEKSIGDQGEVLDEASGTLEGIRRQTRNLHSRIRERMEQILRRNEYQKMFQESIVTIRADRYVVPIKQEFKNQFPGIVHDQSASGATLFIEPMLIVNLNNDLRRLNLQEKEEIIKILTQITLKVALHSEEIESTLETMAQIDFILAKGRLSQEMDGISPILNNHGFLKINKGRHPLLGKKAVPTNVHLGKDFRILVITGPNTGGKTVTLKTIGLLTLMTQSGLQISAEEGSVIAVFSKIFSDIGDEQSIEQSLSTFSSHMTYIAHMLPQVHQRSLVLLDELGAGTDPTEGAALAMAILEDLYERKARVVATTHYSELKNFSYSKEGIENASVEFSLETLSPTYRLLIGVPGSSNAFAIAERLGLNYSIIQQAKEKITQGDREVANILRNLEENKIKAEQERWAIDELKKEIEELKRDYQRRKERLQGSYDKILARAYEKAEQIIHKTQQESRYLMEELKKAHQERNVQEALQQAREKMNALEKGVESKGEKKVRAGKALTAQDIQVGMTVYVPKLGQKGQILSKPDHRGEVQVQVGVMKINLHLSALEKTLEAIEEKQKTNIQKMSFNKLQHISPELDLRGLLAEEALAKLDKYLDDINIAGLSQVNIIHGKGTGALRQAVHQYLKIHPLVEEFHLASFNEGGDGATVVRLGK